MPVSRADVAELEAWWGRSLPTLYKEVLEHCAGGYPIKRYFRFFDTALRDYEFGSSLAVLLPPTGAAGVRWYRENAEFLPERLLPFAEDGGGDLICMDHREGGEPAVAYWHHGETSGRDVSPLSQSFDGFLAMLGGAEEEDDYDPDEDDFDWGID